MTNTKKRITLYIITGLVLALVIGAVVLMLPGSPTESVAELLSLGERFLSELNYEQALVQFLRVIEIEPRNAQGYYGAARAYLGLGQIDNTIDILRLGVEMTGDGQLQALLDELMGGRQAGANDAINIPEAVAAPFTPAQRTLVERIADAMLAGDYEQVAVLMMTSRGRELADILTEHSRGFIYRGLWFQYIDFENGGQSRVTMDNTQDGSGMVILAMLFHSNFDDTTFIATSAVRVDSREYRNWVANGAAVRRSYSFDLGLETPMISEVSTSTFSTLNGYYHGEHIRVRVGRHSSDEITSSFENGLYVPLGPARADGWVPVRLDQFGRMTYLDPSMSFGFDRPYSLGRLADRDLSQVPQFQ